MKNFVGIDLGTTTAQFALMMVLKLESGKALNKMM